MASKRDPFSAVMAASCFTELARIRISHSLFSTPLPCAAADLSASSCFLKAFCALFRSRFSLFSAVRSSCVHSERGLFLQAPPSLGSMVGCFSERFATPPAPAPAPLPLPPSARCAAMRLRGGSPVGPGPWSPTSSALRSLFIDNGRCAKNGHLGSCTHNSDLSASKRNRCQGAAGAAGASPSLVALLGR